MSQTAYKQGMLAWDGPTNYVIYIYIWSCLPVENKVMPSFGITIIFVLWFVFFCIFSIEKFEISK